MIDHEIQLRQIVEQKVGPARFQILGRRDSGANGDGPNAVFTRRQNILRGIADQRDIRDPSIRPSRRACSIASLASPPRVGAISPNAPKRK